MSYNRYDTLIVGAGINGLATAIYLARRGQRVMVIDKGLPARESSWAGSGILAPLPPWRFTEEVNAIASRGMRFHDPVQRMPESVRDVVAEPC